MKSEVVASRFSASSASAAAARDLVERTLERWQIRPAVIEDGLLLTSELVSNVVRHADTACRVRIRCRDGTIRVEVEDQGGGPLVMRTPSVDQTEGRGLRIVAAVATRWGNAVLSGGRHVVWFELDDNPQGSRDDGRSQGRSQETSREKRVDDRR
jgi:anti-sigma regulatory factor (Ser/Thr protein kinase)